MVLNTHNNTPKTKLNKPLKIMFIAMSILFYGFLVFMAIVCSVYARSIAPALVILIPFIVLTAWVLIEISDMERAYVEINGDTINVVDYYLGIKKEKVFLSKEIKSTEIARAFTMRAPGYRYSTMGICYIIFRGENNKYLFKIMYLPETKKCFEKYLNIKST